MAEKIKIIVGAAFGIWLAGAAITAVISEIERRHDCVKAEGFIKGLLWCKTDSFDRDGGYMKAVIGGLRWPFLLMEHSNGTPNAAEKVGQSETSKEEFDKSAIGTMYKCYAVAVRAGLKEEASVIGQTVGKFRKNNPVVESNHDQFMFYSTATIHRIEKELNGDFLQYYNYVCREPVSRMKQVLDDGML